MDDELKRHFNKNYVEWKEWHGDTSLDRSNVFATEVRRAGIKQGAEILEVGFGKGLFLDWAKEHGFPVVGVEIDKELVEQANSRGHKTYFGDIHELFKNKDSKFDLIVLFDVLEHMTLAELVDLFELFSRLLKPDGRMIARFPNGASPFGRLHQYGDATHQTVLTASLVHQIALPAGMRLVAQHDAARPLVPKDRKGIRNIKLAVRLVYLIGDVLLLVMSLLFFGKRIPMTSTLTVVVGKK